ncbi:MAG: PAS domain S-box protein [Candidatus Aminicenantes bacterium]|nr:PAS domain S-box protein [Candidatus Aminicenantes bacterium]
MTFQFSPWALAIILSALVSVVLAVFSWRRRRASGGWMFFWLMIALAWWQIAAATEMLAVSAGLKLLLSQVMYVAMTSIAPLFFLFCFDYREFQTRFGSLFRSLFWIVPAVITALAFTNSLHGLVWSNITPAPGTTRGTLVYSGGPALWFLAGYSYALLFGATVLLLGLVVKAQRPVNRQAAWIILGAIFPWLGNMVYLLKLGPAGVDLTPFGFILSGIFLSESLFRQRLLSAAPVAYGSIFDFMADAVIVFDGENRVVEANPAAERLFSVTKANAGETLEKILESWPEYRDRVTALIHMTGARTLKSARGSEWLETRFFNIYDRFGEIKAWYLIARDITETHKAEEERAASSERIHSQRKLLLKLSFSRAAAEGDFPKAIREITETVARNLDVERTSVWLGNAKEGLIRCTDLYEKSRDYHAQGPVLMADRFPRYFEALARDRVIDASDAAADPRTREFNDSYLRPLGIGSMLDAPIRVSGAVIGVVCCEHVGPPRRWLDDEVRFTAEVADAISNAYTNWEKRTIEDAHRESEERFRKLVEGAPDGIFVQAEGVFAYLNAAALRLFGAQTPDQLLGRPLHDRVRPQDRAKLQEQIKLINEKKRSIPRMEEIYLQLDGTPVETETSAVPIRYRELDGALVFIREITERKRAEAELQASYQEKVVLLREIQSRVRNNMQIVMSLLNHQAAAFSDPVLREAFRASRNRIKSIALVHEKLYRSEDLSRIDFADYIQSLVVHLFQVYQIDPGRIRYTFDLSPSIFNVNISIPLGLIVNELVVNALQYAFPDDHKGEILIRLAKNEGDSHTLLVRDDGIGIAGPVDLAKAESLGFQLVGMLAEQIRGEVKIETAAGVSFTITFPARPEETRA